MAIITVNLSTEEVNILNAIATKTGRTPVTLLENYLHGFIRSLKEEAYQDSYMDRFSKLSFAEKEKALSAIPTK